MSDKPTSSYWIYYLGLLLTVVVWGVNFPVIKIVLAKLHPVIVNAIRMTLSTILLGMVYWRRQATSPSDLPTRIRANAWRIIGLGVIGHGIYQLAFIFGLNYTTSGNAALIMASAPFWTALTGYLLGSDRISLVAWGGLILTIIGTSAVVIGGQKEITLEANTILGNVIMVAASAGWGIYTALSKPLLGKISPLGLTFFTMLVAPPVFWVLSIPYLGSVEWAALDFKIWGALIYSGALSTGLAYVLWNRAVKFVGASHTAGYGNLVPLVALFSGFFLLNEPLFVMQLIGGGMIIAGLLVMQQHRLRRRG